ncbi:MAG: AAA family ATPase [Caldilineaceae bacterium]|nr:AAA family ATPase [Caldilineaceae bacterium]
MFVLLAGLPGVGKSTLANALAAEAGATVLDRDKVRDSIFPAVDLDYTAEQNELASQVTYLVAEYIARRNPERIIILDGRPFSRTAQIREVERLAARAGHALRIFYLWAPDDVVAARLQHDLTVRQDHAANRNMRKYRRIQQQFEPIQAEHLSLDASVPLPELVRAALAYITQA